MKLSYVVPRYGLEVVGGAESAARSLAERLVAAKGWEVEVLTTCALDAMTWAEHYQPGKYDINGVTVRRFASEAGRDEGFHPYSGALLAAPEAASLEDAERWVDLQGPVSSALISAITNSSADLVVFYPYLYHPTVVGLPLVADRAVFHPAVHDEPPVRLPVFRPVFESAAALVFQTYGERALAHRMFRVGAIPQIVLGLGVDEPSGPAERRGEAIDGVRHRLGLGQRPYLVSVARYLDDHKGTDELWSYFREYKRRRPGPLALVLAGQVVNEPVPDADVISAGMVTEEDKWALLRGSTALMSASAFEAFSLIVVEGWAADSAVVVNGHCDATMEHARRSGGGLWYEDYPSFEAGLDRLLNEPGLRDDLVRKGGAYVEANFRWEGLIGRYANFLESVLQRRRVPA
jgi:glycosyltransferase involved in cell wall biosynthesis